MVRKYDIQLSETLDDRDELIILLRCILMVKGIVEPCEIDLTSPAGNEVIIIDIW